jgi:heme exporter protein C
LLCYSINISAAAFHILLPDIPFSPLFLPSHLAGQYSTIGPPMIDKKNYMHKSWWKIASIILLIYTFIGGFLMKVPTLPALQETIRNLYFHVCMWFAMMILFTVSVVNAIKYLRTFNLKYDIYARQFAVVGIVMGVLGYATGAIWMTYTWADPNNPAFQSFGALAREPKLIGAAIALLIYFAYLVLRDSVTDMDKRARISSVYNIFAYAMLFPSIWILPRVMDSLHPGREGNPALNTSDIDSSMRIVFYPAVIGWTLLGVWITTLKIRLNLLKEKKMMQ